MGEIVLELPLPPSANHRYVRRRDGRVALTHEARSYDVVVYAALGARRPRVPKQVPLTLEVEVVVDHRRRRDLDNVLKQLVDSLCRCLGVDDAWVDEIVARKRVVPGDEPRLIVVVRYTVAGTGQRSGAKPYRESEAAFAVPGDE
jgi:Holliday junction resolvase RusA-like endonuclease